MQSDKPSVDIREGPDAVRSAVLKELSTFTILGGQHKVTDIRPPLTGATSSPYELDVAFYSALWSLVRDGIIVPGKAAAMNLNYRGDEDLGFPYFTITPYGREVLEQPVVANPYDSYTYLNDAQTRLGQADDVIYTYLREANKSFLDGNFLSATVMLGISAEGLMKWLIGQYLSHLPATVAASQKKQFDQLSHRTERLFTQFVNALTPHYVELNQDLVYQAKAYLDQLNSIIRVNRDDVAHGRAARVDRQLAFGNLAIYPTLLSLTRELADALTTTKCTI